MKLLTAKLLALFAETGNQRHLDDPLVITKFVTSCGTLTWYVTEYNPETDVFYGCIVFNAPLWEHFMFKEENMGLLGSLVGPDNSFEPMLASELNLL